MPENEYHRRQDRHNLWGGQRMTQKWPVKILALIITHGILLTAAYPQCTPQHRATFLTLYAAPMTVPSACGYVISVEHKIVLKIHCYISQFKP